MKRFVWPALVLLALLASALCSHLLASRDPIAEVLLGRAGSTLPLALLVLLLRIALFVFVPPLVAAALVGAAVRRMQRTKAEEKSP